MIVIYPTFRYNKMSCSNFPYRKLLLNHILLIMSDISNDERKVPFKNDDYIASGTSSFRKACKSIIRDNKI